MGKPALSVIIITKNEERNIRDCLESVKWADEIIVVDSGSEDATVAISKEYTDKVFVTDWPGFGAQKNRALDYAQSEWVFSIDADERITEDLKKEILETLKSPACAGYEVRRLSSYCGKFMRHSGWWPDRVLRLFRREDGRFNDNLVHEKVGVKSKVGRLKGHLIHYTYRDMETIINKINCYTTAGALQKVNKGKRGGVFRAVMHGSWMFFRTYILKLGFLDGPEGFMLAVSNAEMSYYKYIKMRYIKRES
ncbi:MAG: glycosyltransferase family 2 protein [Gammaproteobacteria bacterium]|nr:glycosyltransferase family 2 protein [Gammaproteobacteria bacterium]